MQTLSRAGLAASLLAPLATTGSRAQLLIGADYDVSLFAGTAASCSATTSAQSSFIPDYFCGTPAGGVTYDASTNTIYRGVALGTQAQALRPDGTSLGSWGLTSVQLLGAGFDERSGVLWGTDGDRLAGWQLPGVPSVCVEASLAPAFGPFQLPAGIGFAEDLDWDPWTGTLWLVTDTSIANVATDGSLLGSYSIPVPGDFAGLAFDRASPFGGHFYITQEPELGVAVRTFGLLRDGSPAPDTYSLPGEFHNDVDAWDTAFAPLGAFYATGGPFTLPPLTFLWVDEPSVSPNPGFSLRMEAPLPGATALAFASPVGACPVIYYGDLPLLLAPPPLWLLGTAAVPADGQLKLAAPIPPGIPTGLQLFAQAATVDGLGLLRTTNGISLRVQGP